MEIEFKEHEVQWNRELSSRFWNFLARSTTEYFSEEAGPGIVRVAIQAGVPMRGRILDFGCGPGHLLDVLAKQKISCEGADFSDDSVRETNARLPVTLISAERLRFVNSHASGERTIRRCFLHRDHRTHPDGRTDVYFSRTASPAEAGRFSGGNHPERRASGSSEIALP